MAAIMVIGGAMSMYYAITGQGKAFENDYPKSMKEEANSMLRKFLWIIGPIALASGVLELVGYPWGYYVGLAIIPLIVVYVIMFRSRFKDVLKNRK